MDFEKFLKEVSRGMTLPSDESPTGHDGFYDFDNDPEEERFSNPQEED